MSPVWQQLDKIPAIHQLHTSVAFIAFIGTCYALRCMHAYRYFIHSGNGFSRKNKMNLNLKKQQPDKSVEVETRANDDNFNFESWARAVRPQLLAVLQKRIVRR